jgi:SAM-dependent methyltransferase
MSVEEMSFADDRFDVVFCVATMEHVARPDLGFAEIGRVVAPFGLAYVCSTPLWHSRQGHHKADIFDVDDYPWLHLRYSADELKRMCADGQIALTRDVDADPHIDYMLDVANMNQLPARAYVAAASALERMVVERNELELEDEAVLGLVDADSLRDLEVRGIDQVELRALTHHYVGWKDERPREAEPPPSRLGFRSAPRRILRRMRPR